MITFQFNDQEYQATTTEELRQLLYWFDQTPLFELWAITSYGPSLCMLRNDDHAWLMYLRHEGDSGFSSRSASPRSGTCEFQLSNGQLDEYPLSWCIELEQCYKAIAYFFENTGARPDWISWNAD